MTTDLRVPDEVDHAPECYADKSGKCICDYEKRESEQNSILRSVATAAVALVGERDKEIERLNFSLRRNNMQTYSLSSEGKMLPVKDGCEPGEWIKTYDPAQRRFPTMHEECDLVCQNKYHGHGECRNECEMLNGGSVYLCAGECGHYVEANQRASAAEAECGRLKERAALYDELIYQVGNKYPNETRHQTAMRYLQRAEQPTNQTGSVANAAISGSAAQGE